MNQFCLLVLLSIISSGQLILFAPEHNFSLKSFPGSVSNIYGKNFSNIHEAIQDGVHFIEHNYKAMHLPSLVYGISHRGKLIYNHSWGMADLENRVPADMDTRYRICSISKTFTSALIGHLVEQGRLSYDEPVRKILHYYPQKYWKGKPVNLTIGQLLSHTAGTHVTQMNDFYTIVPNENHSDLEERIVQKFQNESLRFKPGTAFNYSNIGFEMLGSVVETIMGEPYPEVIKQFVTKHGLHQTVAETPWLMLKDRARYYQRTNVLNITDEEKIPTGILDTLLIYEGYYAAGGILSTVHDLLRWGQMMLDSFNGRKGAVLNRTTVQKMWSPHTKNLGPSMGTLLNQIHYGYGWFITNITQSLVFPLKYKDYVWHSGGLIGTTTILMINPELELVGVAMTNEGYVTGLDWMVIYMAENIGPFLK